MKSGIIFVFLGCCLVLLIGGCGSSSTGGVEFFDTLSIAVSSNQSWLDSDVAFWIDSNNNGICEKFIIQPDYLPVKIRSKVISKDTTRPASDVRIENVIIEYTPADDRTPPIDCQFIPLGQIIEPDQEVELNIMIVSQNQKASYPLRRLIGVRGIFYKYNANLIFNCREIMTNRDAEISTEVGIQVSDFVHYKGEDEEDEEDYEMCDIPLNW
ncbi:MAG: hypothetical protein K6U11_09165 [bacterium]|nr:hypothetical protein [bacterium]